MLEKISYKNHVNESIIMDGTSGIFCNSNDLRDFAWSITKTNDKISSFKKGIVSKKLPVIIKCDSEEEGIALKNRMFEVMEKDVLAMKYGQILIGAYHLNCYVTGSKKSKYYYNKGYLEVTLTIQTDMASWIKETLYQYGVISAAGEFLDYPYDYPYDYKSSMDGGELNNMDFVPCNFKLIIYGFVTNPTIFIGGHEYTVNVSIDTGEYLVIDSIMKTIILKRYDGTEVNCFNNRNKDSYVFEKIKPGSNPIMYNGSFKFDVTLIEERGEPKWT